MGTQIKTKASKTVKLSEFNHTQALGSVELIKYSLQGVHKAMGTQIKTKASN